MLSCFLVWQYGKPLLIDQQLNTFLLFGVVFSAIGLDLYNSSVSAILLRHLLYQKTQKSILKIQQPLVYLPSLCNRL
jgi:hypothetical protein